MTTATTLPARRHGTRACYATGCRRLECRAANANYQYDRSRNRTVLVDAAPVRAHVQMLRAGGMGKLAIARRAPVARSVMDKLLGIGGYPQAKRVRPETARRLLAVRFELGDHALVDAAPTWQLIRGMVAAGYTEAWIATELGRTKSRLQLGDRQVLAVTARRVAELAERCAATPGPSDRARSRAAWSHHGWTVDQLWEALDGTSDSDEGLAVDEVAVERALAGERLAATANHATKQATAARLLAAGVSRSTAATRARLNNRQLPTTDAPEPAQ